MGIEPDIWSLEKKLLLLPLSYARPALSLDSGSPLALRWHGLTPVQNTAARSLEAMCATA